MSIDPHTPVVVGVGQVVQRVAPSEAVEPLELMHRAAAEAIADAGAPKLGGAATSVWAVDGAWRYPDPARAIADRLGATATRTGRSTPGGNTPQALVNRASARIAAGEDDVVVIVGAEAIHSRRRARAEGVEIPRTTQPEDTAPDETLGDELEMALPFEEARGLAAPVVVYPLFESAIRAARGETLDEHRDRLARLWAGFAAVAADNPFAWRRERLDAATIREPGPGNRMVGFPYTKAMNSNWDLDQGAALVLASAEAAERVGVARDRWVFPLAGTGASDGTVSYRADLGRSASIRHAGARLFELTGLGPDELGPIDLYSCFPSAVQVAATELGIDEDRPLTVTGGLTFAGGPLNNYVTHSIATTVGLLRERPDDIGLVTANGGYLTKHALGLYSASAPDRPYVAESVQGAVEAEPTVDLVEDHIGPGTLEAWTVVHDREGPTQAVAAVRIDATGAARTWACSSDPATMEALLARDRTGEQVEVDPEGALLLGS